jgi:hypothetical protein
MASRGPGGLISLLVPPSGRRLLVLGFGKSLVDGLWGSWEKVRVVVPEDHRHSVEMALEAARLPFVSVDVTTEVGTFAADALVIWGIGAAAWQGMLPQQVVSAAPVFAAIGPRPSVQDWADALSSDAWILDGLPLSTDRPTLWLRPAPAQMPWSVLSPPGRLDLMRLRVHDWARRFGASSRLLSIAGGGGASVLSGLLGQDTMPRAAPGCFWFLTSSSDCLMVFALSPHPGVVLKIPMTSRAQTNQRKAVDNLIRFREQMKDPDIANLLPRASWLDDGPVPAALEARAEGVSAYRTRLRPGRKLQAIRAAADVLARWQAADRELVSIDLRRFEELWEQPLRTLRDAASAPVLSVLENIVAALRRQTVGRTLPLVPQHGDYWLNNLLWDLPSRRITGILDWNTSVARGLPGIDLFHLLLWRTRLLSEALTARSLRISLLSGFRGSTSLIVRRYWRALELDDALVSPLFCRYWLGEAATRTELLEDPGFQKALELLCQHVRTD